ncbi:hypothetical protein DNC80_14335, partial [Flavobacterium sp. SOK18b]|uniref:hypothetical protein n=1 Tax=Flavobacterium sp. SOK18b TaxID=797900 RepID=UPI0015FCBBE0
MNSIDSILYRPLRSGKEYEGLIPTYLGLDHNFDKSNNNSNTYDTLKYMALWANKYANQMSKVTPMMKGRSLQETINNIYSFLYNHFQYKLDGETQQLFSPSAAWFYRKKGFDCKTYSILASTILQNLKVPHSFRMVKQSGIMPGEWSHVYVIVPNGNSYYTIDATTHDNKEVSFTNKYDHQMKHVGLASPYTKGSLGCACSGKAITKRGLGAPSVLSDTINNFHEFLNELEKNGISKEVSDTMLGLVKWNVENGIDPNMSEILDKAILSQKGLGSISPISSLNPTGYKVPLPTAPNLQSIYTAPLQATTFGSTIKTAGMSSLSNLSVGGVSAGSIVSAATGDPLALAGVALSALKKIIPVDKTFGQLFSNGFNLSCWGSSRTPSETKVWIERDLPIIYAETVGKSLNQQSLNLFIDTMNFIYNQEMMWGNKMQSCSKTALHNYGNAAKAAKEKVITQLQSMPEVILTPAPAIQYSGMQPFTLSDDGLNKYPATFTSERYILGYAQQQQQQ